MRPHFQSFSPGLLLRPLKQQWNQSKIIQAMLFFSKRGDWAKQQLVRQWIAPKQQTEVPAAHKPSLASFPHHNGVGIYLLVPGDGGRGWWGGGTYCERLPLLMSAEEKVTLLLVSVTDVCLCVTVGWGGCYIIFLHHTHIIIIFLHIEHSCPSLSPTIAWDECWCCCGITCFWAVKRVSTRGEKQCMKSEYKAGLSDPQTICCSETNWQQHVNQLLIVFSDRTELQSGSIFVLSYTV